MADIDRIWASVLQIMKDSLPGVVYNMWIEKLYPYEIKNGKLIVYADNAFSKTTVENNYLKDLQACIDQVASEDLSLEILDSKGDPPARKASTQIKTGQDGQQYFSGQDKDLVDTRSDYSEYKNLLNPKYTFDSFIKGKSNQLALAASKAVSENPSTTYNPLFLWGGPGLGKTHLMHAIAHEILEKNPRKRVLYTSSETFTNEMISAIAQNKNRKFRDKYRNIDVLLIDDIQFIAGKQGTQEELFHTFNDLHSQDKQVILSSDRPPKEIKTLETRLISRFEWGLIVDISLPDYETRVAILQARLEQEEKHVSKDILEYLAMNIRSNIRVLEGALTKILAYQNIVEEEVQLETVKNLIQDIVVESEKKPITIPLILEETADYFQVTVDELKSKVRSKKIAYPRQIAMYLSRSLTELSLMDIGQAFDRDHSTVIHGIRKVEKDLEKDQELKTKVQELQEVIENSSS